MNLNPKPSEQNPFNEMKKLKLKNPRKIAIGHLNINSIRNKFTAIIEDINNNLDIIVFSETKLGDSFPTGNF